MSVGNLHYAYLVVLIVALIVSLAQLSRVDRGGRIVCLLLGATTLAEYAAFAASRIYRNNLVVYSLFGLVQLFIVCLYFNETIDLFRRRNLGWYIAICLLALGVANICLLQPLGQLSSYHFLLMAIATISMALFSFARLMLRTKDRPISLNPHFWFAAILTFFWSVTFISWGLYEYMNTVHPSEAWVVNALLLVVNIITYAGFGAVFLFYPRLRRKL